MHGTRWFGAPGWVVIATVVIGPLFIVGDSQGWVENVFGRQIPNALTLTVAILVIGSASVWDMVRRTTHIRNHEQLVQTIASMNILLLSGNELLSDVAHYKSAETVMPMYFIDHALPKLTKWNSDAYGLVLAVVPEYVGIFANDGDLQSGTENKAAAIQQLEGRLKRLGDIVANLTRKLD